MPGYRQHLLAGSITFIGLWHWMPQWMQAVNLSPKLFYAALVATLVGSLFPDIDTKSMIQMKLYQIIFLFFIICMLIPTHQKLLFFAPLTLFPLVVHHRSITHHPIFLLFFTLLSCWIISQIHQITFSQSLFIGTFFIAGTLSHLVLDFGFQKTIGFLYKK